MQLENIGIFFNVIIVKYIASQPYLFTAAIISSNI